MQLRLTQITYLNEDIKAFKFAALDGGILPPSEPGAHITFKLTKTLSRSYSVLNSGTVLRSYDIAVKKETNGKGGSRFMHDNLPVGTVIEASKPINLFTLEPSAKYYVLIGGGIGITPIYAMWQKLKAANQKYTLYYACRSKLDGIMLEQFNQDPDCHIHFDNESGIFNISTAISQAPADTHFYCCGPIPMLNAYHIATEHLPKSNVHFEHFAATTQSQSTNVVALDSYEVFLAKSQKTVIVEKHQSILETLIASGFDVEYSCQQGICGQCETQVLDGVPCHTDQVLTNAERESNNTMMICCSTSKSPRLVLNL